MPNLINLTELSTSSFDNNDDIIAHSTVARSQAYYPFELMRQFINEAGKDKTGISQLYKETLKSLKNNFNQFQFLGKDDQRIPIKCVYANPERAVASLMKEENLVLPFLSISQVGDENDDTRRRFNPMVYAQTIRDTGIAKNERIISLVSRPVKIIYLLNVWVKYTEDLDQIKEQVFSLFNPALTVVTKFSNKTLAFINEFGDNSSYIVGDREDRVIRKQFEIQVQAYLPTKKYLYTSTGDIQEINLEVDMFNGGDTIFSSVAFTGSGGGAGSGSSGPPGDCNAGFSGTFTFTSSITGTAYGETAFFSVPSCYNTGETTAPLLVVFHAWNEDAYSGTNNALHNTQFYQQTVDRGWYLLIPTGQVGPIIPNVTQIRNRGNVASFENTRRSIRYMLDTYPNIDRRRILGVSFSHSGNAGQYAARYLDPVDGLFAGIIIHTGGTSARFTQYEDNNATTESRFLLAGRANPDYFPFQGQFWSEVSALQPEQRPFEYEQGSLITIDQNTSAVAYASGTLANNLKHITTMCFVTSNEPVAYLASSTRILYNYLTSTLGYSGKTLVVSAGPGNHAWSAMDPTFACNFLASCTLTYPSSCNMWVDRDGRFLQFGIVQDFSGWSNYTYNIASAINTISIVSAFNIDTLLLYTNFAGLSTGSTLNLTSEVKTMLTDFNACPSQIFRDGREVYQPAAFTFDDLNKLLTLFPEQGPPSCGSTIDCLPFTDTNGGNFCIPETIVPGFGGAGGVPSLKSNTWVIVP
jgi:hypothetical protein